MSTISNKDIAEAIFQASKDKSHSELVAFYPKVVNFLSRRHLLTKAPEILAFLQNVINKKEKRVMAKVSSASKIDHKTHLHLQHFLKNRYKAEEVVLAESLDTSLIGGFKIEVDDEVIDLSTKNKIGQLQEYLIKTA